MDEFRVNQAQFTGPLDLLLYLIEQNEISIEEINLADLSTDFQNYLSILEIISFEHLGDFIVTAAILMESKSRSLLSKLNPNVAEHSKQHNKTNSSSEHQLIQQLLQYRESKSQSTNLAQLELERQKRYHRANEFAQTSSALVDEAQIWDLVHAFGELVRTKLVEEETNRITDEQPQAFFEELITSKVSNQKTINFEDLFERPFTKVRLIAFFLALLELIKQKKCQVIWQDNQLLVTSLNPGTFGSDPVNQEPDLSGQSARCSG